MALAVPYTAILMSDRGLTPYVELFLKSTRSGQKVFVKNESERGGEGIYSTVQSSSVKMRVITASKLCVNSHGLKKLPQQE
jgi:hypothetical protein